MRTTIKLDDELLKQALEYDDNQDLSKSKLVNKAFRALVRRERLRRRFRMKMALRSRAPLAGRDGPIPERTRAMQTGGGR